MFPLLVPSRRARFPSSGRSEGQAQRSPARAPSRSLHQRRGRTGGQPLPPPRRAGPRQWLFRFERGFTARPARPPPPPGRARRPPRRLPRQLLVQKPLQVLRAETGRTLLMSSGPGRREAPAPRSPGRSPAARSGAALPAQQAPTPPRPPPSAPSRPAAEPPPEPQPPSNRPAEPHLRRPWLGAHRRLRGPARRENARSPATEGSGGRARSLPEARPPPPAPLPW